MKKYSRNLILWTVILCSIIVVCVGGSVKGSEELKVSQKEQYYREQEEILLQETKNLLHELGFRNSGVTLNRITRTAGDREYTFTIHHDRIDRMDGEQRSALVQRLSEGTKAFLKAEDTDKCIFRYEFLIL